MKAQKRVKKVKQAKAEPLRAQDVKAEATAAPQVTYLENPPPHYLLEAAKREPNRRLLEEYDEVIRTLRDEKQFTFREIAEWLNQNGVETDHNAIYRQYTKNLTEQQAAMEERQDVEVENNER